MGTQIFTLLGGEKPREKRIVAEGTISEKYVEYLANRTKEILNIYKDNTKTICLGSIYKSKPSTALATDDCRVSVAGDWEDFAYLIGENLKHGVVPPLLHESGLEVVNSNAKIIKNKEMNYKVFSDVKEVYDVQKHGNSVLNFLYNSKTVVEIAKEKKLDLSWVEKKNYRILTDTDEIMEWVKGLEETDEIVGFDTETSGLLVNSSSVDIIVGICMSYEDNAGVYFPINHVNIDNVEMGQDNLIKLLRPFIDKRSKRRKKLVTHNGSFDIKVMHSVGVYLNVVLDTFARFSLTAIAEAEFNSGLKTIAKNMLNIDVIDLSDMYNNKTKKDIEAVKDAIFNQGLYVDALSKYHIERSKEWKDLKFDFRFAPRDFVEIYGSADADFPRLIHKLMDITWDSDLDMIYNLEIGVMPAIAEQEYYGVKAVESEFHNLYDNAVAKLKLLEEEIYAIAGKRFDIGSPKQKSKILFEDMGCPVLDRFYTKSGAIGTGKDVLEALDGYKYKDGSPIYPIASLLQKHSKLVKLISSFYGKLPNLIHAEHLYPSYKSFGAETGRFSCSNPNLQQTEPTSRHYMIPDSDDYYFLICDYSQVEYRIMAGLSNETKVIDFFKSNPEADYHIMAVSNMMGIPYEDVTPKQRKLGKKLNFGTTYGLGDMNLALNLYGNTTPLHQMMARQSREMYFAGVPVLRDYFEKKRDEAQEDGYAKTMFGRIRDIKEFSSKNPESWQIASGRRKAGNMGVQGTAADLQKMALTRIYHGFKKKGHWEDEARIVMNIHDEVVVQVHKSLNPWYALSIVKDAMEIDLSHKGFPPLYIGGNVGDSWADGKEDSLEAPVMLMDRKVKEVKELLANGTDWKDLPTYENPKSMWLEEIRKFSLEQVQEEIEKNNVQNLDDFHKAKRGLKYAMVYNEKESFENNIYEYIKDNGWEKTYENIDEILNQEPIKFVEKVTTKGKEIQDGYTTLKDYINSRLTFNKETRTLTVHLLDNDSDLMTYIDFMLVESSELTAFDSRNIPLKLQVKIGDNGLPPEEIRFRRLLSGFLPLFKELIGTHLTGGSYVDYKDKIEDKGNELLK